MEIPSNPLTSPNLPLDMPLATGCPVRSWRGSPADDFPAFQLAAQFALQVKAAGSSFKQRVVPFEVPARTTDFASNGRDRNVTTQAH